MDYKEKYLKYKFKYLELKKQIGGDQVALTDILLTNPIIKAIREMNKNIDLSQYSMSTGEQGFGLPRMESMKKANLNELLEREPVDLKKTSYGKYEIQNGRHRIARAIAEGYTTINARII